MTVSRTALRSFAACAAAAVVGVLTAQLVLTNIPPPTTLAERVGVYAHPVFRARAWVILVQVFAMFLALWGLTLAAWRRSPGLILTGFLFFAFWQLFELIPRSVELFAESYRWAPAFLSTGDPAEREAIVAAFRRTGTVLDALGHVRRALWFLGHLLFGLAFVRGSRLEKAMGAFFLFNAGRLAARMVGELAGLDGLTGMVSGRVSFVVGIVPLFATTAWWLWTADPQTPVPASSDAASAAELPAR